MAAKFVLEKDPAGRFRFRLVSQGRVLASSESYTTKRAAQNAIASVKSGAASAPVEDSTQPETADGAVSRPARSVKKLESVVEAVEKKVAAAVHDVISSTPTKRKRASGRKAGTKRTSTPL